MSMGSGAKAEQIPGMKILDKMIFFCYDNKI